MKFLLLIALCVGVASCQSCVGDKLGAIQPALGGLIQCVNGGPSSLVSIAQSIQYRVNDVWTKYTQVSGFMATVMFWMSPEVKGLQSIPGEVVAIMNQVRDGPVKECISQNYGALVTGILGVSTCMFGY